MIEVAERVLGLGLSVVLDFGFWTRAERDSLRARARAVGAAVETHYLDPPLSELQRRLAARNGALPPDTFGGYARAGAEMDPHFQRWAADETMTEAAPSVLDLKFASGLDRARSEIQIQEAHWKTLTC